MKVEIIDFKSFKLISENKAEAIIMNEWGIRSFVHVGGRTRDGIFENIYKLKKRDKNGIK